MASFKLRSTPYEETFKPVFASDELIRENELRGLTHINYDGVSHFLNIDDINDREALKDKLSLYNYEWFREETGDKKWVLYNKNHFHIIYNMQGKRVVHFNERAYDGSRIELPINASSCCGMFSWTTIPDNMNWTNLFNTSNIVDMSLMFAGCTIPDNMKSFHQGMQTKNVRNMKYMFYDAFFPSNFVLDIDTSSCNNMEYMFSRARVKSGFKAMTFLTGHVAILTRMFFETKFNSKPHFGGGLVANESQKIGEIVIGCKINGKEVRSVRDLVSEEVR